MRKFIPRRKANEKKNCTHRTSDSFAGSGSTGSNKDFGHQDDFNHHDDPRQQDVFDDYDAFIDYHDFDDHDAFIDYHVFHHHDAFDDYNDLRNGHDIYDEVAIPGGRSPALTREGLKDRMLRLFSHPSC